LLRIHDPELAQTLHALLSESALRGQALRALAAYDDPETAALVLKDYATYTPAEKRDALNTLASRLEPARALMAAVGSGKIAAKDLSAEIIRQLREHKNATIDAEITRSWGSARETTADKASLIKKYKALLTGVPKRAPDPALGRAMFAKTCQQCHTLFGAGEKIGPDLTGSNRADLDYVLANVLDPSALIGKDYTAQVISTTDGRLLTGLIRSEDNDAVTLVSANDVVVVPKSEIDARRPSDKSMMPDDLWTPLSEHEVRSLVAYLASPAQVPMLATAENVATFFNGRDLQGWQGSARLWSVENGEIVGKTQGLSRNEFLRSEMMAGDFRLTLKVKLVANQGNSGVQFRSEAQPDGEVFGYQADIGPGWWGKLYEEGRRGLLWSASGESHLLAGEWNQYEIVASRDRLRTFLNGHPCVHLDDPGGTRRGIFAFQLHSGGPTEVRFKDIRLELDPKLGPGESK
jgi:putative heme-binding domain-containing protein